MHFFNFCYLNIDIFLTTYKLNLTLSVCVPKVVLEESLS